MFDRNRLEQHRQGIELANQKMTEILDVHFNQNYQAMRQEILDAGIESERIDHIIQQVKLQAQIAFIRQFKKKLAIVVKGDKGISYEPK